MSHASHQRCPPNRCKATHSSAELFDPDNRTWTLTGAMNTPRYEHTGTLLSNGKVLVAGGWNGSTYFSSAELYDPANGLWTTTGVMMTNRLYHTGTLLPDGRVLIAEGYNGGGYQLIAELYNSSSGTWVATGALGTNRIDHTATLLPNGKVLVAGGYNGVAHSESELYDATAWTSSLVVLAKAKKLPNGAFQLGFAGNPNGTNTVIASTNLTIPISNWTSVGTAGELSRGLYLFSDLQATNSPLRFYKIRFP